MSTLLDYTVRISLILSIALVVARMARHKSAALRHLILACGMFCAAALPVLNLV